MELKEMIAVMQAAERGEQIQCRSRPAVGGRWCDNMSPSWDWSYFEYRVKPKPLAMWGNVYREASGDLFVGNGLYGTQELAEKQAVHQGYVRTSRFVEQLD